MLPLAERDYQALRTQSGAAPHHLPEWKKAVVSIAIQPASPYAFHQWTRVAVQVDPRCRGPLWSHPKTPANTDLGDRGVRGRQDRADRADRVGGAVRL
jgi:hypothetical protein